MILLAVAAIALAAPAAAEPECRDPELAAGLERANENVRVALTEADGSVRVEAVNLRPFSAELLVTPTDGGPDRPLVLPPLSTTLVMEFAGIDKVAARDRLRVGWRLKSYLGDPAQIAPDSSYRYRLPFRPGKTYRLVQGFGGQLSHQSEASQYALDFQLEVGEPVHAARDGVVVRAVDWFCRSGGRELVDQTNMVIVAHDDGTMAHYVHLDHGGVLVREGDRVERGQQIARSGQTGFTGGPHLHFVVMRERDVSIPVRFEGYDDADLSRRGRFKVP